MSYQVIDSRLRLSRVSVLLAMQFNHSLSIRGTFISQHGMKKPPLCRTRRLLSLRTTVKIAILVARGLMYFDNYRQALHAGFYGRFILGVHDSRLSQSYENHISREILTLYLTFYSSHITELQDTVNDSLRKA